jgi:EAL domain-containing protein (putative c-di-GMP-specific phosphodiesterase class I)
MAEDLGIINDIGDWVLKHAIEKAIHWQIKYNKRFIMSVNVSGLQLEQVGFAKRLQEIMTSYNYPPSLLELEITETRLIRSSQEVFQELRAIKDIGVKIALDDFGTGFSSLTQLIAIPLDYIKLDTSFISAIGGDNQFEDKRSDRLTRAVLSIAKELELYPIIEGVETEMQCERLKQYGATLMQGYLFSRPLKLDDACNFIDQYNNQ